MTVSGVNAEKLCKGDCMNPKDIEMFVYYGTPLSTTIPKLHYLRTCNEEIHYRSAVLEKSTNVEGSAYVRTEEGYWLAQNTNTTTSRLIGVRTLKELKNMTGTVVIPIDESTYTKYIEQYSTYSIDRIAFTHAHDETYCVLSTYDDESAWNIYCANKFLNMQTRQNNTELHYILRGQYNSRLLLKAGEHDIEYPLNTADEDTVFNNTMLGVDYAVLNDVVQMYEYSIGEFEKLQNTHKMRYIEAP